MKRGLKRAIKWGAMLIIVGLAVMVILPAAILGIMILWAAE